jgi:type VI secretion system protein ImpA
LEKPPEKTTAGHTLQDPVHELRTRSEVSDMLTKLIDYFQTNEPSHPAPIFLNRVQRMLGANFHELMDELYPDANQLIAKLERPGAL